MKIRESFPATAENPPAVKKIRIAAAEFREFRELQQKHRWDWPAVFSTNSRGKLWPFRRFGRTPENEREDVTGLSKPLDQVAGIFAELRPEGGRFFIDERGAFFKSADGNETQFVKWDSGSERLSPSIRLPSPKFRGMQSLTYDELLERSRSWRERVIGR